MNHHGPDIPDSAHSSGHTTTRDIALFFSRHIALIATVIVMVNALAITLIYLIPQVYWAKGVVLMERGKSPTIRSDPAPIPGDLDSTANSEIEIIKSRGVVEMVVDRLELDKRKQKASAFRRAMEAFSNFLDRMGLLTKLDRREKVIRGILNNLEVKEPARSDLLNISYADADPVRAMEVTRAIMDAFIEKHHMIFTDNTTAFFESLLESTEADLAKARADLQLATDPSRVDEIKLKIRGLEAAYLLYRDKRDRGRVASEADKSLVNIRVVDYPKVPVRPSFSRLLLILAAFGASLVLAISLALLVGYFDHNVYAPSDLPVGLELPVVASIRYSRAGKLRRIRQLLRSHRKALKSKMGPPRSPRDTTRKGLDSLTGHQPALARPQSGNIED